MFGYIKPDKAELKIKDYETYKAIYCSLCNTLGKEYGLLARFFLTYDATFYVLFMKCIFQHEPDCAHNGVCRFNPLKKCNYIDSDEYLKGAAALSIILFFYKIKDNINDARALKKIISYIVYPYAKLKFNKALKKYSKYNDIIKESIDKQNEVEFENTDSVDKAAHYSAKSLEKIFSMNIENDEQRNNAERFGYCLGRWVYLMDAFDDLESDIKSGSFNAYVNKYQLTEDYIKSKNNDIENDIIKSIRLTANETALAMERLEKFCYTPVTENIIFDGMEFELQKIINKKRGDLK